MAMTALDLARAHELDTAYQDYARVHDAALEEHGVRPRCARVDVDGVPIYVQRSGAGAPVLFLHGTPAIAGVWTPLLPHLSGIEAIVIDRPGHGLSGAVDYFDVPEMRSHAARVFEGLLDALGLERVVLAGSSLGGLWSMWLALDCPARVAAVIGMGASPGLGTNRLPLIFGLLSVRPIEAMMGWLDPPTPSSALRMISMMGDPPESVGPRLAEQLALAQRLPNARGGMIHCVQRNVRFPGRLVRAMWIDDQELARVRPPVLYLWGDRDFLGGSEVGRRSLAAVPRADVVPFGRGHLPWLQDPAGAAERLVAFATRAGTGAGVAA